MAVCPKCGRSVNETVIYSLSEANRMGGETTVKCNFCGHAITYVQPGYNARMQAKSKAAEAAKMKEEKLTSGYSRFATIIVICTFAASLFCSICMIIRDGSIWSGVLVFICSIFPIAIPVPLAFKNPKYPIDANADKIKASRNTSAAAHVIGCILFLGLIGGLVFMGLHAITGA